MRPETDPNRLDAIWPEFVRDFHPLAVSLVGENDAPDLFQETYLEALRIEPRYKERYGNARNPRSRRFRVLVVILRRVAIHARRSEQKQMRAKASLTQVWMQNERDVNESRPIETPAPPLEDPGLEMVICRAQLSVLTQECLEDYRLGLPTSHSAKRLGISEGAAKAHLATAWKRLRAAAEVAMYHRMEEDEDEMTEEQEDRIVWRIIAALQAEQRQAFGLVTESGEWLPDGRGRLFVFPSKLHAFAHNFALGGGYRVCQVAPDGKPVEERGAA